MTKLRRLANSVHISRSSGDILEMELLEELEQVPIKMCQGACQRKKKVKTKDKMFLPSSNYFYRYDGEIVDEAFVNMNVSKTSIMSEFMEYNWRTNISTAANMGGGVFKYWDPKDRIEALKCLRDMIRSSDDYELKTHMPQDDSTLLKFLYARKFDLEDSFTLLKNHFWYRKRNPEIFDNLTMEAEDIEKALENGLPGVLEQKDRKGRCVLVFTGSNWDCSYGLLGIYRALLFSLERLIEHVHNQTNGFVVIVDWTEFTFRQTTHLKPSILKLMIEGLQDCFPARFKGIHFINQPWYVEAALGFIKLLLIDRVKERIFVHGNNLSTLHEHIHKDILPAELGGEQPSYNPSSFLDSLRKLAAKN